MTGTRVWAVVVAGGCGRRYAQGKSKLLETLNGRSVLQRSLQAVASVPEVNGIVLVYHPQWLEDYQNSLSQYCIETPILWVPGGASRRESVWNGLQALPPDAGIVLIHDAARPLVSANRVTAAIAPVASGEAVGTSLGIPVQNTLKRVTDKDTPWVEATLSREGLWQVHTPQVFRTGSLMQAHREIPQDAFVNDDAELVEQLFPNEKAVLMVQDDPLNIKITTPGDLQLAESYLRTNPNPISLSSLPGCC